MRLQRLTLSWALVMAAVQGRSIPLAARQDSDYSWVLVGYGEPDCKGAVVANWRGSSYVPQCIAINATQSVAGGSGAGTNVNLWEDDRCTAPASSFKASGEDPSGYPCYNTVVRSFTVDK
ncbi:hypothetical protein B0T24DRAFT_594941 [Lasiosphaeria ovina]|uniref:Uncharacterized protein n=1 Tax=Lasiosphaeria ovina TaxID=92902 RepID=A0AAE0K818_9PEZI|nr:hypothetical protein B0T24DRAFT_594941 [Lasiosphaeria ovina]